MFTSDSQVVLCARNKGHKISSMSTEQLIYSTAIGAGIPAPVASLMVAQSKHETANYTSNFFKRYNNAFGYSFVPGAKWQLPEGGTLADNNQKIAAYSSVYNSTMEMVDWLKRRVNDNTFPPLSTINDPAQYAFLLKKAGYYGDTLANYSAALTRFYNSSITPGTTENLVLVASIVLAGVTYYIMKDK